MRRPLVLLTVAAALLGACSSDDGGDTATSRSSTSAPGAGATTTTVGGAVPRECSRDVLRGSSGPPPAQGAALPDGQHFGFVTFFDAEDLKLQFDVAQLFTGDAATKAAAEDGGESPPPNDYWIRNNTKATRLFPFAADAALCAATPGEPTRNEKVSLSRFNQLLGDGEPMAAWIDVGNGTVERVEQQFFP